MPYETDHHPCDGPFACEPTHARSATSTSLSNAIMSCNNWPAAFGGCRPVAFCFANLGLQQTVAAGPSHFILRIWACGKRWLPARRIIYFFLRICSMRILRLPGCAHPLALHQRAARPPTSKTTHPGWNHLRPHRDLTLKLQVASIKNHTSSCSMLPMKQNHASHTKIEWMTHVRHCNGQLEHIYGQHQNSI